MLGGGTQRPFYLPATSKGITVVTAAQAVWRNVAKEPSHSRAAQISGQPLLSSLPLNDSSGRTQKGFRFGSTETLSIVSNIQSPAQITPLLITKSFLTKIVSMEFCNLTISHQSTPRDILGEMFTLKL